MFPVIPLTPALRLSTWGVLVFLAMLALLWRGRRDAPARGLPPDLIERSWPWLLIGGMVGAHAYYMLAVDHWPVHALPLKDIFNIFSGTAVQGGLIGGFLAATFYVRRAGYDLWKFCDVLSPAGALAQAVTRVGCFAAGCCYGRPTHHLWGVVFTSPFADPSVPRGIPLHPAQLYEALLDLGLAVFLQRKLKEPAPSGTLFAWYLMGASLIRFVVQFFRDDDAGHLLWGLAHSQWMSISLFILAAWMYHKNRNEVIV